MGRSSTDILTDLIAKAQEIRPDWSWSPNSPEADLVTVPTSEFARANAIADYVRYLTNLYGYEELQTNTALRKTLMEIWEINETELDSFLQDDLDNFSEHDGVTRNGGSKAKVPVNLMFSNNNQVTIALGIKFISAVRRMEYLTIEPLTNKTPILISGNYILRCFVECTVIGNDGNITAGSVMQPVTKVSNLIRAEVAVNIDNGQDKESNLDFVQRIRLARISKGVGSRTWLRNLLLSDDRVYDVYLNAHGDTGFERVQGIDAWVHAQETPRSVSEVVKRTRYYNLEVKPLIDESSIITGGYILVNDRNGYERSVESLDYVDGPTGNIQYYTDDTIRSLQLVVEDLKYWLLGGRRLVLVKKGKKTKIDFRIKLYLNFGSDLSTVKNAIENNLLCYFAGGTTSYGTKFSRVTLDQNPDKTDLLNIILNTEGVDRIDLNSFRAIRSDGLYSTVDPIPISFSEFSALGSITWL
jgi:hypothetical protein